MKMRRRPFLIASAAALAAACGGGAGIALPTSRPTGAATGAPDELDAISELIMSGGPPPDGIPPIEKPQYISLAEASAQWNDDDVVDAFTIDGEPRAYPRMITVWHEIVNETAEGKPIAITYCPLTGSTLVFSGVLADGTTTTFGTSGQLYNSNLVMYDRATDSMWPQLFATAVRGDRKGERLRELTGAVTTTFGRWKRKHPDGLVLSTDTGHARSYGVSPYGSYDTEEGIIFPVRHQDDRFLQKKVVVGVRENGAALAIPKAEMAERREASAEVGSRKIVALYDEELDAVSVLDRDTTEPLVAYDVMWFAWYAFNPETAVLE
ncbi:MAG: DUF3179 domain-containing protein [Candidatus Limnocylindria bacterium]